MASTIQPNRPGAGPGVGALRSAWEGFHQLRSGAGLVVLSSAMMLVILIIVLALVSSKVAPGNPLTPREAEELLNELQGAMVAAVLGLLVASLVGLVGFIRMLAATGKFARISIAYDIGSTAVKAIVGGIAAVILGLLILLAGAAGASLGVAMAGASFALLGMLAIIVGWILFALFISRLSDLVIEDFRAPEGFRTAGRLLLLGTVLGLLSPISPALGTLGAALTLVAYIMIYAYSGQAIEELNKRMRGLPTPIGMAP